MKGKAKEYAIVLIHNQNTFRYQKNNDKEDGEFTFNDAELLMPPDAKVISHGDYRLNRRKSPDLELVRAVQDKFFSNVNSKIIIANW